MVALRAVLLNSPVSLCPCRLPSPAGRTRRSSILCTHFQVPYPVSPVLATLTKTGGVYTNNSHSGFTPSATERNSPLITRHSSLALKSFPFIPLRTLLHTAKLNSFLFKRFRTLCQKPPGWGYGHTMRRKRDSSHAFGIAN